jgi:hypothetical protein
VKPRVQPGARSRQYVFAFSTQWNDGGTLQAIGQTPVVFRHKPFNAAVGVTSRPTDRDEDSFWGMAHAKIQQKIAVIFDF